MESKEDNIPKLDEFEFDALFDIYLRPLKSNNARRIFKVLAEEKKAEALTTLDIQAKLDEQGIMLSKKEINGWLHSLNAAGLAVKGVERGKPTTLDYEDKYTFDLWRLTDLGVRIARGLPSILGMKLTFLEANVEKALEEISEMDGERRTLALRRLDDLYLLARILRKLTEAGGALKKTRLTKRLTPTDVEVERILSSYSDPSRSVNRFFRMVKEQGPKIKLLSILGLSPDRCSKYALTEEGVRLARALWSLEAFGH